MTDTEPSSAADDLPNYRVLTWLDDCEFCKRVSATLDLGYDLHGGPAISFDGSRIIVAQAPIRHRPDAI